MGRRGRPRHPDILTPREWDVLALLREGLSNEEIAERLGITERTAKYHVSEILSKLGVATRQEAARWEPTERRWWTVAAVPVVFFLRKAATAPARLGSLAIAASVGLLAVALGGLGLIAFLLLRDENGTTSLVWQEPSVAQERLAFSAGGSIYTVAPDGSGLREVIPGDRASAWNASPAFSPDGSQLAFTRDFDVWIRTADGQDVRRLADVGEFMTPPGGAASNWSLGAQSVAWSPDGEHIMYSLARIGGSGVGDIWVMRPDGSERTQVHISGNFLLPTWLDSERIAAYEGAGRLRLFLPTGEEEAQIVISGEERVTLTAAVSADGQLLIGPFINEGPIMYGTPEDMRQVAMGVGPALSPDGRRVAYFADEALRIVSVDGSDDEMIVDLAPLGGRDRFFGEQPECFPDSLPSCSYRLSIVSWWAAVNVYRADHVGLQFAYPPAWTEGAPDAPFRQCSACTLFGPPAAPQPYGVRFFFTGGPLDGCGPTCFAGSGRVQQGAERTLSVGGRAARQVQLLSTPPLGYVDQTGDDAPYHEVWTLVPLSESGFLLVAFYRDGDTLGQEDALAAYEASLDSLRFR